MGTRGMDAGGVLYIDRESIGATTDERQCCAEATLSQMLNTTERIYCLDTDSKARYRYIQQLLAVQCRLCLSALRVC